MSHIDLNMDRPFKITKVETYYDTTSTLHIDGTKMYLPNKDYFHHNPVRAYNFAKLLGVVPARPYDCVCRLIGKPNKYPHEEDSCLPPAQDHLALWLQSRKPLLLQSQPYWISARDVHGIDEFCHRYNLNCLIDSRLGWYNPDSCTSLIYWHSNTWDPSPILEMFPPNPQFGSLLLGANYSLDYPDITWRVYPPGKYSSEPYKYLWSPLEYHELHKTDLA